MEGEVNSVRNDKKRVNGDDDDAKPVGDISRVSTDGPHKYYHFHAFEFHGHSFQINDSVLVTPEAGKIKPTVLFIKDTFQTEDGELMIKGQRMYRPEDCTIKGIGIMQSKNGRELFYSSKIVKVPANAVIHKCVIHLAPNNKPTLDRKVHHGFFVKKTYDFERNELRDLTERECEGLLEQGLGPVISGSGPRHAHRRRLTSSASRPVLDHDVEEETPPVVPMLSWAGSSSSQYQSDAGAGDALATDPAVPWAGSSPKFMVDPWATDPTVDRFLGDAGDRQRPPDNGGDDDDGDNGGDDVGDAGGDDDYEPVFDDEEVMYMTFHERRASGFASGSRKGKGKGKGKEAPTPNLADMTWTVRSPVMGGPVDGSVIPSFCGHIAYAMQEQGLKRKVVKCQSRQQVADTLLAWRVGIMSRTARRLLSGTGLDHLPGTTQEHIDHSLLNAFLERWQPDTNTFHLPFGEMTILLHDVYYIMKLPIDGHAVPPQVPDDLDTHVSLLFRHDKDIQEEYEKRNARQIVHKTFWTKLKSRSVDDRRQVLGWLTLALGSLLFTDKTGHAFRPRELVEVSEDGFGAGYAWGTATLAYLYRQLGIATRTESMGLSGCLSLLQSWIYEYFPTFRTCAYTETRRSPPLSATWVPPLQKKCEHRLAEFRARLDALKAHEVVWCPYGRYEDVLPAFPLTTYRGLISYRDVVEPYMPDRCVRQFGFVQGIPHHIIAPPRHKRGPNLSGYSVGLTVEMARLYWSQRNMLRFPINELPRVVRIGQTTPDYMDWYTRHSHPLLLSQSPDQCRDFTSNSRIGYEWADRFLEYGTRFVEDPQMYNCPCPVVAKHVKRMKWLIEQYKKLGGTSCPPPPSPPDDN